MIAEMNPKRNCPKSRQLEPVCGGTPVTEGKRHGARNDAREQACETGATGIVFDPGARVPLEGDTDNQPGASAEKGATDHVTGVLNGLNRLIGCC